MNIKKTLAGVASYALVGAVAVGIGGTFAGLKQEDYAANMMTTPGLDVVMHETQRDGKGGFEPFTNFQEMLPTTFADPEKKVEYAWAEEDEWTIPEDYVAPDGADGFEWRVFDSNMQNVIDKFVTVENKGKSDAYVRTIIAYEYPEDVPSAEYLRKNDNGSRTGVIDSQKLDNQKRVEINGQTYWIQSYTYLEPLGAGETTIPSLKQVFLKSDTTNEICNAFGDTIDVLVLSQATQVGEYTDAATALNADFGEITAENVKVWFEKNAVPVNVDSDEELAKALATEDDAVTIVLEEGTYTTNLKILGGKDVTIVGSKDTILKGQIASLSSDAGTLYLSGVTIDVDDTLVDSTGISQTEKSAIAVWGNQNVICENVTFNMSLANSTAITSWWATGTGTTIEVRNCTFNCNGQRPIRSDVNVTVENCTFNDPYRYAVQMTAKSSTADELDNAVVNFNNNTIINGENGKDFVYGVQLEGTDYGCSNLIINGSGNTIVTDAADRESRMYFCECGKVDHGTIVFNTEFEPEHAN